jgi:hypothetical protein
MTDPVVLLMTGAEVEGSDIPSAVPVEDVTSGTQGAAGRAPEPMEVSVGEAAATTGGEGDDALPEPALEVVFRSSEIQDAELIRSAPMSGAATSSRDGTELLADDLVDPATVARHMEAMRQAEQWMKVSSRHLGVVNPLVLSTQLTCVACCRMLRRGPGRSPTCFKGTATQYFGRKP